jgi:WD40 repeat protein/serine/threonine protein kinase
VMRQSSVTSAQLPWQNQISYTSEQPFLGIGGFRLRRIDPNKLQLGERLGAGKFGEVCRGSWEGASVAIKEAIAPLANGEQWQNFVRETQQLAALSHPRVICFYGISTEGEKMRLVMEYCPGKSLRNLLQRPPVEIDWPDRIAFGRDIALGLSYLHANDVLHTDLTADNVLLDVQGRAKLADFGLAVKLKQGKPDPTRAASGFRAAWNGPEILAKGVDALSWRSDMYSFGVVLWEIATRCSPDRRPPKLRLPSLPSDTPARYRDVIQATWDAPEKRPTAVQAFVDLGKSPVTTTAGSSDSRQLCAQLRQNSVQTARLWQDRFDPNLPYIPLRATTDMHSKRSFPALGAIEAFLEGAGRVLLLLGDSGIGKSLFLAELTKLGHHTPILASLPSLDHPEQDLMETLLEQQGLTSGEIEALKREPLLLLLDGYDEIQTDSNLYITNQLERWNVKVVITCRTERISRMQGDCAGRFSPPDRREFEQLVLQPFDETQIEAYVKEYVHRFGDTLSGNGNGPELFSERLRAFEGLSHQAANPFCLALIVSTLRRLGTTRGLTRREIYAAFLEQWYKQQKVRLQRQGLIAQDARLAFDDFAQDLALTLFRQQTTVARYRPKTILFGEDDQESQEATLWARYFDNRYHPHIPLLRAGCPLQTTGDEWSFLHKSIWEYYVAKAIVSSPRLLNLRLLTGELGIVAFLADVNGVSQDYLFQVVRNSRDDETLAIAAANSMTILNFHGVSFSNQDLHGVHIRGARLSGGVFDGTNLKGADLTGCELKGAWLSHADLSGANLTDVNLGQLPYLQHEASVECVSYSRDGRFLATGAANHVYIWDASTSKQVLKLEGHKGQINSVAFSPDGRLLASASGDGTVRVWETPSGRKLSILPHGELSIQSVAFSPDGKFLCSFYGGYYHILWETTGWQQASSLKIKGQHVAVSPDGQILASLESDAVRLYALSSGMEIALLEVGSEADTFRKFVVFSPDGSLLAVGENDYVRLWKTASRQELWTLREKVRWIDSIALSPDGKLLAVGGSQGEIHVWEIASKQELYTFHGHSGAVNALVFSPDGHYLTSGSSDGLVGMWEVTSQPQAASGGGHRAGVSRVAFSPGGTSVASTGLDGTLRVWNFLSSREVVTLSFGKDTTVRPVVFSPDGGLLAAISAPVGYRWYEDARLHILETSTWLETRAVARKGDGLAFSPDGTLLASVDAMAIEIREVASWQVISRIVTEGTPGIGTIDCIAFSPDGKFLAGSNSREARVFSWRDGSSIRTWKKGHSPAFNPKYSLLAYGVKGRVHLCETLSWQKSCALVGNEYGYVLSFAFGPDGQHLATADKQGIIRIGQIAPPQEVTAVVGHRAAVGSVAFSPDGKYLVSASDDGSVRCWRWNAEAKRLILGWIGGRSRALAATQANIEGVIGLSPANLRLLQQHGAQGAPKGPRQKL